MSLGQLLVEFLRGLYTIHKLGKSVCIQSDWKHCCKEMYVQADKGGSRKLKACCNGRHRVLVDLIT